MLLSAFVCLVGAYASAFIFGACIRRYRAYKTLAYLCASWITGVLAGGLQILGLVLVFMAIDASVQ